MGIDFAGSDYLEKDVTLISGYPITMACWLYPTQDTGIHALMWHGDKDVADEWNILQYNAQKTGDPIQAGSVSPGNAQKVAQSGGTTAQDTWQHCLAVFTSDSLREVWRDNADSGSNVFTRTVSNADRFSIGRTGDSSPTLLLTSRLAHCAMWNKVPSANERAALAAGVNPLDVMRGYLVGYWPLSPSSKGKDVVGANSLTLNGTLAAAPTDAPVAPPRFLKIGSIPLIETGAAPSSKNLYLGGIANQQRLTRGLRTAG